MSNIISNIKAQSQKIYNGAKELILEDGLIQKSLGNSIDKVHAPTQKDYSDLIRVFDHPKTIDRVDALSKVKGKALSKTPKEMSILGTSLTDDQVKKVGQAVANKQAIYSQGLGSSKHVDEKYSSILKKTKGAIAMNMPGSIAKNYYINPLTDGISAIGSTSFKDNKRLHQGITRASGTALGLYGAGKLVSMPFKDRDKYKDEE